MNRTIRLPIILFGMLGTLLTSGCEIPQADAGQTPPPPAQAGNIAPKRQGLTAPVKGKVASFTYGHNVPVAVGSNSGCKFLLDTCPTRLFLVSIDSTNSQEAAADGMCRMALDSLKGGTEIAVIAYDDAFMTDEVVSVTMTR